MRIPALALCSIMLAGCVSDDGDVVTEALNVTAYEDDAHCKSLLLRPGELVYAQCRLAMEQTYLKNYNTRKAAIEAETGAPISESFERALRTDAFCNYDESMKVAPNAFDEAVAANLAYANCEQTRSALEQEIAALGRDPMTFTLGEQPTVLKHNLETIRETKSVINGPGA
ncbi:MAG: hypothetical protein KAG89_06075 [Fulvimarina manganoxydans]|uniref:hypothetical protein n=1 Tax=Fulvimarina manganoxydans TaxID=937218 RepID=UPI002353CC22|nr:hypothetical protein [Fulvimarina manganoxydans]MCK5931721.1 hypothetical protein [Fulvimarina manganoxydans]MEE2950673.1 hypothetical protein [Pseudomonadota bacterium]